MTGAGADGSEEVVYRAGPFRIEITRVERVQRFDVGISVENLDLAVATAERLQCALLRGEARSCRVAVRDASGKLVHAARALEESGA